MGLCENFPGAPMLTGPVPIISRLNFRTAHILCMRFNVCSPLFRHQETTKPAHSPTAVALCLPLFSVNNDLHA